MTRLDVNVQGSKETISKIKNLIENNFKAIKEAVRKCAFMVEKDAKWLCPVDTGRLRASITTNYEGSGQARAVIKNPVGTTQPYDGVHEPKAGKKDEFIADVGTNVEYAPWIEGGTKYIQKIPFLYSALKINQAKINSILKDAIIEASK